jgi:flagellar assembly protein FliH
MPSSPEITRPWAPAELSTVGQTVREPEPTVAGLSLFEVAGDAGIPDSMLEPARRAAQASGYAAGWAAGVRAGRATVEQDAAREQVLRAAVEQGHREQVTSALAAVHRAAEQLEARAVPAAEFNEDLIIRMAYDLAESLVGAMLRDDRLRGQAAVRRVLALAPVDEPVTVALHPHDHAVLLEDGADQAIADSGRRSVTLVADPSVARGDAVATAGAMTVEGRLDAALARARQALLGADASSPAGTGKDDW